MDIGQSVRLYRFTVVRLRIRLTNDDEVWEIFSSGQAKADMERFLLVMMGWVLISPALNLLPSGGHISGLIHRVLLMLQGCSGKVLLPPACHCLLPHRLTDLYPTSSCLPTSASLTFALLTCDLLTTPKLLFTEQYLDAAKCLNKLCLTNLWLPNLWLSNFYFTDLSPKTYTLPSASLTSATLNFVSLTSASLLFTAHCLTVVHCLTEVCLTDFYITDLCLTVAHCFTCSSLPY